jgi:hypothetical protein
VDKIEVIPTENVEEAASLLRSRLHGLVDQAPGPVYVRKTAAELPQYVLFLGSVAAWLALVGPGEFLRKFFGQLGETSANAVMSKFKKPDEVNFPPNLMRIAEEISAAHRQSGVSFRTALRLQLAAGLEADLWLSAEGTEKIAYEIARCFAQIDRIESRLRQEETEGRLVISPNISIRPDGTLSVSWLDGESLKEAEFNLDT